MAKKQQYAWLPKPVVAEGFNKKASIPHGCTVEHIMLAMNDFIDFLTFINTQLEQKKLHRMESFLMPANFSSMVGEFMAASIPKYCKTVVKNSYHNGHPDLVPKGFFPKDSILHGADGIEIKASRHISGWQGHNPEDVWLMVFVFDSNTAKDQVTGEAHRPFKFRKVYGAQLKKSDWTFSGRSETSRRTITASINRSGFEKMKANWIYSDPES